MQFGAPVGTEIFEAVRFLGIDLKICGSVLRPREETELLGSAAQKLLDDMGDAPRCIDMFCGAGNLAIALAMRAPGASVWASDLSSDAVATARLNASCLDLSERVDVVQGDLFAPLEDKQLEGSIDLVVANPPYISTGRLLHGDRVHLLDREPREAFDGGPYGIALHMRLINEAPRFLKPGGWLGFEFGVGQERQVEMLLRRGRAFSEPVWLSDEQGNKRAALARKHAD